MEQVFDVMAKLLGDHMRKTFSLVGEEGFQIKFPNGIVCSVMIGKYHYCENKGKDLDVEFVTSDTCEIAFFSDAMEGWMTKEIFNRAGIEHDDDVYGHVGYDMFKDVLLVAMEYK